MKRRFVATYAILCTLLLVTGCLTVFFLAWEQGTTDTVKAVCGLLFGFILAPILHELGHFVFAKANDMRCTYLKCFCFRFVLENGNKRFRFVSPFRADETQVVPRTGGNMKKRAQRYAVGGLVFSAVFLCVVVACGVLTTAFARTNYFVWGLTPYFAYLFFLNLPAFEYASGKTDGLIYRGIRRGYDAEKVMLSAMEIQGQLYEGKRFSEIDEKWFFDLPQLCEDEPTYAVILDLRYRYYLDKDETEKAADCLNRLAWLQPYLTDAEIEKIAAELTYMHAVSGNIEDAEASGQLCKNFLKGDGTTAKRVLIAYSKAVGKADAIPVLMEQAEMALKNEPIKGVSEFERRLISKCND